MRNCVTHHHACDCREERFRKIESALAEARKGLESEAGGVMSFEDALKFMGERPSAGNRKLSDDQLEQVIALKSYGYSYKQLAPKFGVSNPTSLGQMVRKYQQRETHQ